MRALQGPARFGDSFSYHKVDSSVYVPYDSIDDLIAARERANEVDKAISARGLGRARAVSLGLALSRRDGIEDEWWLHGLKRARASEVKKVARAVAEWADGDSIAAHIGYRNDIFCTSDKAGKAGTASVFHADSRSWLTQTFGVTFCSMDELAQRLP